MFAQEPRCIYDKNQLIEVICQLRFPEILSVTAKPPVDFQESIRDLFPQFRILKEIQPPRITGGPGNFGMTQQTETTNYQFQSADGVWRINLTNRFISLACTRYTTWETFASMLDKPLSSFIQIYRPAYFERVGLRYVNAFSRKELGLEDCSFADLIQPCYLGILGQEDVMDGNVSRCTVDAEMAIRGGCRVKLHAGPGMIKRGNQQENEARFILDNDLYMMGQTPLDLSTAALSTLHAQAGDLFRGAITQRLHLAMEPRD